MGHPARVERAPVARTRSLRAVRGMRAPWPGDVTASSDALLEADDVPRWVNGTGRARIVRALAFSQVSLLALSVSYLVMNLR